LNANGHAEEVKLDVRESREGLNDRADNRFLEPIGRFTQIFENKSPLHSLTVDYFYLYSTTAVVRRRGGLPRE